MTFLDPYKYNTLIDNDEDSDLITLEFETKSVLVDFVRKALDESQKDRKGYTHKMLIGYMATFVTIAMIRWLGEDKAKIHADEIKTHIKKEAERAAKKCKKYQPHKNDAGRNDRLNQFRESEGARSIVVQSIRLVKATADSSLDSCRNIPISHSYKKNNAFDFVQMFPYIRSQVRSFHSELKESFVWKSDADIWGYITYQLAEQIAWCAGFFSDLDHEPVSDILEYVIGVIDVLNFNRKILML